MIFNFLGKHPKRSIFIFFKCSVAPLNINGFCRIFARVIFICFRTKCKPTQIDIFRTKFNIAIWCTLVISDSETLINSRGKKILIEEVEMFEMNYFLKLTDFTFFLRYFGVSVLEYLKKAFWNAFLMAAFPARRTLYRTLLTTDPTDQKTQCETVL